MKKELCPELSPENAREQTEYYRSKLEGAFSSKNEVSNEFTRTQIQMAAILLGFISTGIFTQKLTLTIKEYFYVSVILLVFSIFLGLFNFHSVASFHLNFAVSVQKIYRGWRAAALGEISNEDAIKIQKNEIGGTSIVSSPDWIWKTQTFFLAAGVLFSIIGVTSYVFEK